MTRRPKPRAAAEISPPPRSAPKTKDAASGRGAKAAATAREPKSSGRKTAAPPAEATSGKPRKAAKAAAAKDVTSKRARTAAAPTEAKLAKTARAKTSTAKTGTSNTSTPKSATPRTATAKTAATATTATTAKTGSRGKAAPIKDAASAAKSAGRKAVAELEAGQAAGRRAATPAKTPARRKAPPGPAYLAAELGQPVDREGEPIGAGSAILKSDSALQEYSLRLWRQMQSGGVVNRYMRAIERAGLTVDEVWTAGVIETRPTSSTADEMRRYKQKLLFRANLLEAILTETIADLHRLDGIVPSDAPVPPPQDAPSGSS